MSDAAYSYTYGYALNSKFSDTAINIGYSNPGQPYCTGQYGGQSNVCVYAQGVPPGKYIKFFPNSNNTLFAAATTGNTPSGAWTLESCEIKVNAATGEIFVSPWAGPGAFADVAEADRPTEHTEVKGKRAKRGAGAGPGATAG